MRLSEREIYKPNKNKEGLNPYVLSTKKGYEGVKDLREGYGTVISTYRFRYRQGRVFKETTEIVGQSTTSRGQTVAKEYKQLIRNAYMDALYRFRETRGVRYDTPFTAIHIKTNVIYYQDSPKGHQRITNKKVYAEIPEQIEMIPQKTKAQRSQKTQKQVKKAEKPEKKTIKPKMRGKTMKIKNKPTKENVQYYDPRLQKLLKGSRKSKGRIVER